MNRAITQTLCEVAEIIMGQSPESESYNDKGAGIPFYQGKSDFGEVYPTVRMYCTSPKKIAMADDILMSVRAPIGDVNIAQEKCCIGRGLAAIRPKAKTNLKYLFYLLDYYKERLAEQGTGSTFKAISKDVLNELRIPIWPLEKQKWVADVIDEIQTMIFNRKEAFSVLDELVKSRFVEMFGEPNKMDRWQCCKVKDVADVTVGLVIKPTRFYTDDADNGIKAFRSLNVREMRVNDSDWVYFSKEGNEQNKKSQLKKGDVLIVRSGYPGTSCVVTDEYVGCNAIDIIIARPNQEKVNPYYLCAFNNFPHGMNQIQHGTGGAAQKHFNVGAYNDMVIAVPPMKLQNDFVEFMKQADKSKLAVQQSIDTLQTLKDKLMQDYFG